MDYRTTDRYKANVKHPDSKRAKKDADRERKQARKTKYNAMAICQRGE